MGEVLDVTDWTDAERRVAECFRIGIACDLASEKSGDALCQLSATRLAALILTPSAVAAGNPQRFIIMNASITGTLDLGCGKASSFLFSDCTFDQVPMLNDATADFVGFTDCSLPGLSAARLSCAGAVWLYHSTFSGAVSLEDASIADLDAHNLVMRPANQQISSALVLSLAGMRVEHDINLDDAKIDGTVIAAGAHIKGSLILSKAKLASRNKQACFFGKLVHIGGNFIGYDGFQCKGGGVDLEGAHIDGQVNLTEAVIETEEGFALDLDHAVVKLGVQASQIRTKGTVSLHHATIWCQASFDGGDIRSSTRFAIRADHIIIHGSFLLNGNLAVDGPIMLHGAEIDCALNMWGLKIKVENPRRPAIIADGARVDGEIDALDVEVDGLFLLESTKIGGRLNIGGRWSKPGKGKSIVLDRSKVRGVFGAANLHCEGSISIVDAEINGPLDLSDSIIGPGDNKALDLGGTRVYGDVSAQRAQFLGVLDAPQSEITGDLRLADAKIAGAPAQDASRGNALDQRRGGRWRGTSLRLRGARIVGDVDLRGVTAEQAVDLTSLTAGQAVNFSGGALAAKEGHALIATNARMGQLDLQLRENPTRTVDLRNTTLDVLTDTSTSWPPLGSIIIEGLRYRQLDSDIAPGKRLRWLRDATPNFSPQPYDQLAEMYHAKGDADGEREVKLDAIKRMYAARGPMQRVWGFLQNLTVGFGYRPSRVLFCTIGLWLAGTVWFRFRSGSCIYNGIDTVGFCPIDIADHPAWNPALLSLDLLMPFPAFGQDNAWRMSGFSVFVAVFLTLSGWILITTIAAAVARTFKQ